MEFLVVLAIATLALAVGLRIGKAIAARLGHWSDGADAGE